MSERDCFPELTDEEKAALDSLPDDMIQQMLRDDEFHAIWMDGFRHGRDLERNRLDTGKAAG